MSAPTAPCEANRYLLDHAGLLRRSYAERTGRDLVDPALSPEAAARALFLAPFALLSHGAGPDPLLTYANRVALDLFELTWAQALAMPSRLTAEAPGRAERDRLLAQVAATGCIEDYAGVRISRSGRRFRIRAATVWNLTGPDGRVVGQAASFARWVPLPSAQAP